jgi:hypothetical protein
MTVVWNGVLGNALFNMLYAALDPNVEGYHGRYVTKGRETVRIARCFFISVDCQWGRARPSNVADNRWLTY